MNKDIVIYHANCADGFGAAWAARRILPPDTEYVAANYGNALPDVTGKNVHVLDFSYPLDVMQQIATSCVSLTWLDHHKTAEVIATEFVSWAKEQGLYEKCTVIFDQQRSGAGLAWDFYTSNQPRPWMIDLIEDRDLWKFSRVETKPFSLALRSVPMDFKQWDTVSSSTAKYIERGDAMQVYYDQQLKTALSATQHKVKLFDGKGVGLAANLPAMFASEAGNIMAKESGTFGLSYYLTCDGVYACSLRSIGDYDVSEIAKHFGGGGHKNAAGFSCGTPVWTRI